MTSIIFPKQSECERVLGHSGNAARTGFDPRWVHDNVVHVPCPWVLTDFKNHYSFIAIHKMFAQSLALILAEVWQGANKSQAEIEKRKYHVFSGSGCYRSKRGQSSLSMHAYYAAIDFDAPDNQFHAQKHLFQSGDLLPATFRKHGWTWGGDWSKESIDAMHFQGPRVG